MRIRALYLRGLKAGTSVLLFGRASTAPDGNGPPNGEYSVVDLLRILRGPGRAGGRAAAALALALLGAGRPPTAAAQDVFSVMSSCPTIPVEEMEGLREEALRAEAARRLERRLDALKKPPAPKPERPLKIPARLSGASKPGFFDGAAAAWNGGAVSLALDARPRALAPLDDRPDGAVNYPLYRPIQGLGVQGAKDQEKTPGKRPPARRPAAWRRSRPRRGPWPRSRRCGSAPTPGSTGTDFGPAGITA